MEDTSTEEQIFLQAEKLRRRLHWSVELRGFLWFLLFTVLYTFVNAWEIDFQFAHQTHDMFKLALEEHTGVDAAAVPEICKSGSANGRSCYEPYLSTTTISDLVIFTYARAVQLSGHLSSVCEDCRLGVTALMNDPEVLNLDTDFICADFGRDMASGTFPDRRCASVDSAWAAAPSRWAAPCCRNATLVAASFAMVAGRGEDPGILSLDDVLSNESRNLELVEAFIEEQVGTLGTFLQFVISRDQRMLGMNYYSYQHATLDWGRRFITPQIQYWSYRYDMPRLKRALYGVTVTAGFLTFLYDIRSRMASSVTWRAFGRKLVKLDVVLLKVPATILPALVWFSASVLSNSGTILLTSLVELVILGRFFYEGKQFLFHQLLISLTLAVRPIAELVLALLPILLMVTCVLCQLYGVFLYPDGYGGGVFWTAFTSLFSQFAGGVKLEESAVEANPFAAYLLYYGVTLALFLTLSQVFITLLMDSFEKANDVILKRLQSCALPEGFVEEACETPWRLRAGNEACNALFGYFPLYRAWCFPLMRGLHLALAEAAGKAPPGLVGLRELESTLAREGIAKPRLVASELCRLCGARAAARPEPAEAPSKSGGAPKQGPRALAQRLAGLQAAVRSAAAGVDAEAEVLPQELLRLSELSLELSRALHAAHQKGAATASL